ncbi:MAG: hypothetical protein NC191_02580 [Muribaculaceae bacterium]|nr:hypothetical protein [Muribaculaceae bacterium]
MRKFGLCLSVLILISGTIGYCRSGADVSVQSTVGVGDSTERALDATKPTKAERNEQKERENRSNKYIKLRKKISKHDKTRLHKEKELEYLEYRLELKKQKLEMLGVDLPKGEN